MPHRAGHSPVPEFGFPQSWEVASQAIPGFMSPEQYRQIGRGLLDYVPGVSTALNWGEMGPWGRAGSLGLDALDLATAGGGKPVTTPLRAFTRFLRRNDPLVYLRGGFPPLAEVPSSARYADYRPDPILEKLFAEGKGKQFSLGTSGNFLSGGSEPGISTFQALRYLKGENFPGFGALPETQYVMRDASRQKRYLNEIQPVTGQRRYNIPIQSQDVLMNRVARGIQNIYEMSGMNILKQQGADLEALVDPVTGIKKAVEVPPGNVWRQSDWSSGLFDPAFAKYDARGIPVPNPLEQLIDRASLGWTLPWTAPARGLQVSPNLEEQYQQQLGAFPGGGWSPGG